MTYIFKLVAPVALIVASFSVGGNAMADLITAVTTAEGFIAAGPNSGAQTLTAFTDASGGSFTVTQVATGKMGDDGNTLLHGNGTTAPASFAVALSDGRIDTGSLATGNGAAAAADRFTFGAPVAATDKIFLIFNGGDSDGRIPTGGVTLYDAGGVALGSTTVTLPGTILAANGFGPLNTLRVGGADLDDRAQYGFAVDIAAFGVANPALIAGAAFAAHVGADFSLAGIASPVVVPEPSSLALLGVGVLGLVSRRRRK